MWSICSAYAWNTCGTGEKSMPDMPERNTPEDMDQTPRSEEALSGLEEISFDLPNFPECQGSPGPGLLPPYLRPGEHGLCRLRPLRGAGAIGTIHVLQDEGMVAVILVQVILGLPGPLLQLLRVGSGRIEAQGEGAGLISGFNLIHPFLIFHSRLDAEGAATALREIREVKRDLLQP